jgi:hypothetical protein
MYQDRPRYATPTCTVARFFYLLQGDSRASRAELSSSTRKDAKTNLEDPKNEDSGETRPSISRKPLRNGSIKSVEWTDQDSGSQRGPERHAPGGSEQCRVERLGFGQPVLRRQLLSKATHLRQRLGCRDPQARKAVRWVGRQRSHRRPSTTWPRAGSNLTRSSWRRRVSAVSRIRRRSVGAARPRPSVSLKTTPRQPTSSVPSMPIVSGSPLIATSINSAAERAPLRRRLDPWSSTVSAALALFPERAVEA